MFYRSPIELPNLALSFFVTALRSANVLCSVSCSHEQPISEAIDPRDHVLFNQGWLRVIDQGYHGTLGAATHCASNVQTSRGLTP